MSQGFSQKRGRGGKGKQEKKNFTDSRFSGKVEGTSSGNFRHQGNMKPRPQESKSKTIDWHEDSDFQDEIPQNVSEQGLEQEQEQEVFVEKITDLPVYMVYSIISLEDITNTIAGYGEIYFLRVSFVRDKRGNLVQSKAGNIAVMPPETYKKLCEAKFNERNNDRDLTIKPYSLQANSFPRRGQNKDLFIKIPSIFAESRAEEIKEMVNSKVDLCAKFGIIPENSWTISVPIYRQTGDMRGSCFVSFNETVPLENIAMVRVVQNNTSWPGEKFINFEWNWAWNHNRETRGPPRVHKPPSIPHSQKE